MDSEKHVPGWQYIFVPKDIAELTRWFEPRFSGFQGIDVSVQIKQSKFAGISVTSRLEQSPPKVRVKLHSGRSTLDNTHRWLKHHGYRDKPKQEVDADNLRTLEIQMSQMLTWLQEQAGLRSNPSSSTGTPSKKTKGQTNGQKDTGEKKEKKHKMNQHAWDCSKEFLDSKKDDVHLTLKEHVESYAVTHELKSSTLYKRLTSNRPKWDE